MLGLVIVTSFITLPLVGVITWLPLARFKSTVFVSSSLAISSVPLTPPISIPFLIFSGIIVAGLPTSTALKTYPSSGAIVILLALPGLNSTVLLCSGLKLPSNVPVIPAITSPFLMLLAKKFSGLVTIIVLA